MGSGFQTWTDEMDADLRKARVEGLAFSAVARIINKRHGTSLSRSACVGRAHRISVPRLSRQGEPVVPKRARRELPKPQKQMRKPSLLASLPTSPLPPAHDYDIPRIAFADLEPHHCRFPVGEPTQGFCGHSKVEGLSYCEVHARRCYTPVPARSPKPFLIGRTARMNTRVLEDA